MLVELLNDEKHPKVIVEILKTLLGLEFQDLNSDTYRLNNVVLNSVLNNIEEDITVELINMRTGDIFKESVKHVGYGGKTLTYFNTHNHDYVHCQLHRHV